MEITSAESLLKICAERQCSLPEAVAEYEAFRANVSKEDIYAEMEQILAVMRSSVEKGREDLGEFAHLVKGYGNLFQKADDQGILLGGELSKKTILYALSVGQHNASLGKIVACPTAGSCGVVPGALLPVAEELKSSDEELVDALLVLGGIGIAAAAQGPISGAEGGCQAECGVASAMAAGAIVYLAKGTDKQVFAAASLALQSHLGLVCDPLASLVEVPCITRNATSAASAVVAANIALAGIPAVIPFDETVVAMKMIGKVLPESLRETSQGGLAATPTGKAIYAQMRAQHSL